MSGYRQERQISGTARMRREDLNAVKPLRPLGAPPGSGGPAARRRLEQSPVTAFLRELNLGQYAEVMRDHGFDDLETLICIEEPHMREMGMPAGHIVKLKRSLKECGEVTVPRTLQSKAFQPCNTTMTAVQLSWQQVKALGTDVVGGLFYKKFFQIEPKAKALFPISVRLRYKDWDTDEEETEDPEESPALRKLWAKFITVVGSAVAGMQDTEKLVPMLQQLGARHVGYGLKGHCFNIASKVLIEVLAEWLGDSFTKEVENAWVMVSGFMVATMYAGFSQAKWGVQNKEMQLKDSSAPVSTTASDIDSKSASRQITPFDDEHDVKDFDGPLDLQYLKLRSEVCPEFEASLI